MKLNRKNLKIQKSLPVKILQFGEGNFLRAFVDYSIDKLNKETEFNAGIVVVQPIENGMVKLLNEQDGLYTLFLNGIKKEQHIKDKILITSIQNGINPYLNYTDFLNLAHEKELQFVISNTTESGIAFCESDEFYTQPHNSFPAKLTAFLFERFTFFSGNKEKGLTIIPCELINYNADTLKEIIFKYSRKWKLSSNFENWILETCTFHNTLVDRIVPGFPKDNKEFFTQQLEYEDDLMVTAEPFFLWVIEGDEQFKQKFPIQKSGLNVKIVDSIQPYRTRKVRILNGAHTCIVPISLLFGNETVEETMNVQFTDNFINNLVINEIVEVLNMDKTELLEFATEVFDRFRNPYIKHYLSTIALNSISKFKVRSLPTMLEFEQKFGYLPKHLTFSFAALIRFYKGTWQGKSLPISDEKAIVDYFAEIWKSNDYNFIAKSILAKTEFWNMDLNLVSGLTSAIAKALELIENKGIEQAFLAFDI